MSSPKQPLCTNGNYTGCLCKVLPTVTEIGYGSKWRARIAFETGEHYMKAEAKSQDTTVMLAEQQKHHWMVAKGQPDSNMVASEAEGPSQGSFPRVITSPATTTSFTKDVLAGEPLFWHVLSFAAGVLA
eukprot:754712-Prymnesium_polylepis.1